MMRGVYPAMARIVDRYGTAVTRIDQQREGQRYLIREMPELARDMPACLRVPERRHTIKTEVLHGLSVKVCDRPLPNREAFQMGEIFTQTGHWIVSEEFASQWLAGLAMRIVARKNWIIRNGEIWSVGERAERRDIYRIIGETPSGLPIQA
jgi:hypothetical protein